MWEVGANPELEDPQKSCRESSPFCYFLGMARFPCVVLAPLAVKRFLALSGRSFNRKERKERLQRTRRHMRQRTFSG